MRNEQLQAWLGHPSHAVLLTGLNEITSTEAVDVSQTLLERHTEWRQTVLPDEKSTISIEQIRELISFFRLKVPGHHAAIKRVAIIYSAEHMGHEAQNALLKLLEEPPADSVLILTSEQPQSLLATIRSRVQTIHLQSSGQPPESEAVQLVKRALAGTSYDRLLLVNDVLKPKETARSFADTLALVAAATLETTARKGNPTERWQGILQAAHTAAEALRASGNVKLVMTELMLAL